MNIEQIAEKDRDAMMQVIRDGLYKLDALETRQLARRIGKTYDCLIRIRRGTTRWPQPSTLFSLIYMMNLRMVLLPAVREAYDNSPKLGVVKENRAWH